MPLSREIAEQAARLCAARHDRDDVFGGTVARTPLEALAFAKEQSAGADPPDGENNWKNLCLKFCRQAYNVPAKHFVDDPEKVNDARTAFEHTQHRGDKSKQPPAGALMWWIRKDASEGTTEDGHVAIATGDGHIWSNDIRDSGDRQGQIYRVPATEISETWTGLSFAGWSRDINDELVVERDMDFNDRLELSDATAKALGFPAGAEVSLGGLLQITARNATLARKDAKNARLLAEEVSEKVGLTAARIKEIKTTIDAEFGSDPE
jgi:hypothetical protein